MNKLALGTAQFGLNYGIANVHGKVSLEEIKRILDLSKEANVQIIDTAQSYGNSEELLGSAGLQDFKVVTKIASINDIDQFYQKLKESLDNLKVSSLYGLLIHNFNHWQKNLSTWNYLEKCKENRIVSKIGFSLYQPSEWLILKQNGITPDLIQIPINLLNQDFVSYLPVIKRDGTEIHARSAFLQGLLLLEQQTIPERFSEIKIQLKTLDELSKEWSLNKLTICLLMLWQNSLIDHIVLGVDSAEQWLINLQAGKWCEHHCQEYHFDFSQFQCHNQEITNPSLWKK